MASFPPPPPPPPQRPKHQQAGQGMGSLPNGMSNLHIAQQQPQQAPSPASYPAQQRQRPLQAQQFPPPPPPPAANHASFPPPQQQQQQAYPAPFPAPRPQQIRAPPSPVADPPGPPLQQQRHPPQYQQQQQQQQRSYQSYQPNPGQPPPPPPPPRAPPSPYNAPHAPLQHSYQPNNVNGRYPASSMQYGHPLPPPPPGHQMQQNPPPPPYGQAPGHLPPAPHRMPPSGRMPPMAQQTVQEATTSKEQVETPLPPLFTRPNDLGGPLPIFSTVASLQNASSRVGPPPPADSRYLVNDDGNASPQVLRSNCYAIPMDRTILRQVGGEDMDMGVICTPLALPSDDFVPTMGPQLEQQPQNHGSSSSSSPNDTPAATSMNPTPAPKDPQRVPVIHATWDSSSVLHSVFDGPSKKRNGKSGRKNPNRTPPPRCRQCQAYVNPFWDREENRCNFCGAKSVNTNFDVAVLQEGTVEFQVDGPYITRSKPVQPIYLYAVDLTASHVMDYLALLQPLGVELARHYAQQPNDFDAISDEDGDDEHEEHQKVLPLGRPRIGICFVSSFGIVVVAKHGLSFNLVMSDVTEDPYCHVPLHEWTFDVSTANGVEEWDKYVRGKLLNTDVVLNLRKLAGQKNPYGLDGFDASCGGAAMAFLADALSVTGGRATWITSRRPNFGVGAIRHRQQAATQSRKLGAEYYAASPLQLQAKCVEIKDEEAATFYRNLQARCAKSRVVLDMIFHTQPDHFAHQYLDLATLGEVCRATCGKLTWLHPFVDWKEPFLEELKRPILTFQGWDAVFKVRCSTGLRVKSFLSNPGVVVDGGSLMAEPELELSCVTPQSNLAVLLEHRVGGVPKKERANFVYVQSALLYTTVTGKRRVRVSTLALRPSDNVADVFLSIDAGAAMTLLLRRSVDQLRQLPTTFATEAMIELQHKARDTLVQRVVHILAAYRHLAAAMNAPRGQLMLPERLQLLPLFAMCLLKCPMLRPTNGKRINNVAVMTPTSDERAYYKFHVASAGPSSVMLMVRPNVFSINKLDEGVGEWRVASGVENAFTELSQASYHPCIHLPPNVHASMTYLEEDGVYLVDTGLVIYLVFGKLVSRELKQELGPPIAASATDFGKRVHRILWQMRAYCSVGTDGSRSNHRPTFPPVVAVCQGDPRHVLLEQDVMNCMVEDPICGEKDYPDFLVKMHRMITEKAQG